MSCKRHNPNPKTVAYMAVFRMSRRAVLSAWSRNPKLLYRELISTSFVKGPGLDKVKHVIDLDPGWSHALTDWSIYEKYFGCVESFGLDHVKHEPESRLLYSGLDWAELKFGNRTHVHDMAGWAKSSCSHGHARALYLAQTPTNK